MIENVTSVAMILAVGGPAVGFVLAAYYSYILYGPDPIPHMVAKTAKRRMYNSILYGVVVCGVGLALTFVLA